MNARSRGWNWAAGALAVSLLAVGCTQAKKSAPAGIAWNEAFDAAMTDAQAHHRPVLLDFYTDW
jgi:thiol:disulfide interchange protein